MSTGMSMAEALEWAADYAERNKLFAPVTNSRGYADGWKPPTPEEKLRVIQKLAFTAAEPDRSDVISMVRNLSTLCMEHGNIICAPCDQVPPSWRM